MKYDKEERDILDALEKGKMKLATPSKKEIESIKAAANNTLKKDKRITIRLYDHDFVGIQKRAMAANFSWANSAKEYAEIFKKAIDFNLHPNK